MSEFTWDDMDFWQSKEWDVVKERVNDSQCNPRRKDLFTALDLTPLSLCRVCILGQDPYPNPALATGVAFSIPPNIPEGWFPPSLKNILTEYHDDTHHPIPSNGDLSKWCKQGVLLWNVVPTCQSWKSKSHSRWPEWFSLTTEIVECLSTKGIVFVLLGKQAQGFKHLIHVDSNVIIETSHPSPMSAYRGFMGSRIFTRINGALAELGDPPIDWAL